MNINTSYFLLSKGLLSAYDRIKLPLQAMCNAARDRSVTRNVRLAGDGTVLTVLLRWSYGTEMLLTHTKEG
jgi:hypothetical protein